MWGTHTLEGAKAVGASGRRGYKPLFSSNPSALEKFPLTFTFITHTLPLPYPSGLVLGFVLTRDKVKIKEKGGKNKGRKKKKGWLLSQPRGQLPLPFTPPGPRTTGSTGDSPPDTEAAGSSFPHGAGLPGPARGLPNLTRKGFCQVAAES